MGSDILGTKKSLASADGDILLEQMVQGTPVPTLVLDAQHRVVQWNRALELVTGVPASAVVGTTRAWAPFYSHERPIMADLIIDGLLDDQVGVYYGGKCRVSASILGAWEAEDFFPHFPGGGKWLAFTAAALRDGEGKVIGAIETLRDISVEKQAQQAQAESEQRLREIVEGCPVPMFVIDGDHRVTHWNRALETILGTSAAEMIGTSGQWRPFYPTERPCMADLVVDGDDETAVATLYEGKYKQSALIPGAWEAVDHFPHFRSGARWLYFTAAPLHGLDGRRVGAVETLQDISEQKNYELELEHQANHDPLTGLANRNLLNDRLEQAMAHARRQGRLMAVLFVDLDNFKVINDTLGHAVGDELVRQVARRIAASVRAGDTVARVGGDEFVVLLFAPENENAVTEVMQRLLVDVSAAVHVDGNELFVGCSIGAALYPRDGNDPSTLLMHADAAMYRAKESGRSTFHFFTQELNDQATERLGLERDLRHALERDELVLHFQPQVGLSTGRLVGAEALLRWQHPRLGLIPPARFIPLAEETGLIVPIGRWVMEQACAEAAAWEQDGADELRMSINLSPRQFRQNGLVREVEKVLSQHNGRNLCLELELTESMVMHDPAEAVRIMGQLKEMGVRLSMDDFGTGYSSLAYLRSFPFDLVKIDRSFVADLGQGKGTEAIVRAIVALAESFGLGLIAEGVETREQCIILATEGCLLAQGFLYGRPMASQDFRRLLKKKTLGGP